MSQSPATHLEAIFGADGALAAAFDGYQPRPGQMQMARTIRAAINDQRTVVIEAGTGVGKTFGYLAPVLLSGKKAILSTGTKHLQDQLFNRDLPTLARLIGHQPRAALLKGRANYLCPYRLESTLSEGRLKAPDWVGALHTIKHWASRTHDGDITRLTEVPEDHGIWPLVTSTNDNCLGKDCPKLDGCFVAKAREAAHEATLVVINHHLLCADIAIRQNGFAELLPEADILILDEAHQLPDIASQFFGSAISSGQLHDLLRDTQREQQAEAIDMTDLLVAGTALEAALPPCQTALTKLRADRVAWEELAEDSAIQSAFNTLRDRLAAYCSLLEQAAERGPGLKNCHERAVGLRQLLDSQLRPEAEAGQVRWLERREKSFTLHTTPMDAGKTFSDIIENTPRTWVFTSATLAAGSDFSHFTRRLNLNLALCEQTPSPFDYPRQALMYLPRDLPDPKTDPEFTLKILRRIFPVLKASQGRAFLLFTTHRELKKAAEILRGKLPFPLFIQGEGAKAELLERFRHSGNGVLLGTQSFWEGVDVRGDALSVVMIDRIPFAPPDDPVRRAREAEIKAAGHSPFAAMSLPEAIITFKQGVGRLIRDVTDRGVLVLCDPRLQSTGYGAQILNALPPMRRTTEESDVIEFFTAPASNTD
ncbi:ATP-dependent DNA helicase [Halothiobacillus sp. DCM-1]|uniref:ATP-dependent DNA helicase n=1 Tax=Halothiobacillus sp. DCM-1 TaxID=3112558 RepID=UPI0032526DC6